MLNARISGMAQDHTGCFWFGHTMAGLTRFHPYTVTTFSTLPLTESLIRDNRGRVWFTDYTAICCVEDGKVRRRDFGTHLYCVYQDSRGALWVGTRGQGVYHFADPDDFWRTDGTRFTREHGLGSDTVGVVIETRDGVIWVGTGYPGSLCRFDGTGFESIAAPQPIIFRLFEKSDGTLWFGGFEGGGVSCYDGERVETFVVQDGLPSNKIQSFVEDGQGRLWVRTNPCCVPTHSRPCPSSSRLWKMGKAGCGWAHSKGWCAWTKAA